MLSSFKKYLIGTLAFLITVGFLFFAIVNRETVSLNLEPLPYILEVRLFVLIGVLMVAGVLLGWIVASFECRRRYLLRKETTRRLSALEEELSALRARNSLPEKTAQQ